MCKKFLQLKFNNSINFCSIIRYRSEPSSVKMAAKAAHQYFSLRWNNYQSNMTSVFHQLLEDESFVDVTLACEENSLKAHKVIFILFLK